MKLLSSLLRRIIKKGNLSIVDSKGDKHNFGNGAGQHISIQISSRRYEWRAALDPELAVGEGYMGGEIKILQGTLFEFLQLVLENFRRKDHPFWIKALKRLRFLIRRLYQMNFGETSQRNVEHHYDIDPEVYRQFLDTGQNYSCAYYEDSDLTLEEAQVAKMRHIASKMKIAPGQTILDIGCGWGAMAIYLAQHYDVTVHGVTLSNEQVEVARRRVSELGLEEKVRFSLLDYRDVAGTYDRIVSIGMFEHVGVGYFRTFMETVHRLLASKGLALIHSIGRFEGPGATNPFIAKHIFPGGYIPAISEVTPHVEAAKLLTTDMEIWRLHYAKTLRHWRERFIDSRARSEDIMGPEFCRMWEFYLTASELSFLSGDFMVFQIQLCKEQEWLELTRDYMFEEEAMLRRNARETGAAPPPS